MKKLKNLMKVAVVCICVLFGSFAIPVISHATESETIQVEPRMTYIGVYSTDVTISSTGMASITGLVRGKTGVTSTYVKVTLQMSISGDWVDVKSWEDSSSSMGATVAETYQLSSRGTYRTIMTCRANSEEKTATSAYRTY